MLEVALGRLWASFIRKLDVDLCAHTISLDIERISGGASTRHEVAFEHVSAFYFVDGPIDNRLDKPPWDQIELTSIGYLDDRTVLIKHEVSPDPGYEKLGSSANFLLELWSSVLLIEAKAVIIDGQRFEVGYPTEELNSVL